jgi:hypothetical protein
MRTAATVALHPDTTGFRRVINLPSEQCASGTQAADLGYSPRLCHECAQTWFGANGPDDTSVVGLHGGQMCASCGYQPGSGLPMAASERETMVIRAMNAGVHPRALPALTVDAIQTATDCVDVGRRGRLSRSAEHR